MNRCSFVINISCNTRAFFLSLLCHLVGIQTLKPFISNLPITLRSSNLSHMIHSVFNIHSNVSKPYFVTTFNVLTHHFVLSWIPSTKNQKKPKGRSWSFSLCVGNFSLLSIVLRFFSTFGATARQKKNPELVMFSANFRSYDSRKSIGTATQILVPSGEKKKQTFPYGQWCSDGSLFGNENCAIFRIPQSQCCLDVSWRNHF